MIQRWWWVNFCRWRTRKCECYLWQRLPMNQVNLLFFLLYLSFCCFSISHIECLRLNNLTKLRYDRSNRIWSGEQTSGNDNSSVCDEKSLNYAWQLLLFAIRFSVFLSYLCFQSKPFPYFHIIRRLLPFYHQTLPQLHVLAWRIRQYFKYKTI